MRGLHIALFVISAAAFAPSSNACLTAGDCSLVLPTMPQCCCNAYYNVAPFSYASANSCLCLNGYASYCGGSPAPPGTCAGAGYIADTTGLCPGDVRCTGISLGGSACLCPAGKYWDIDACVSGAPPAPPGNCTAVPSGGVGWNAHVCGSAGCAPSDLPVPPPPSGTTFSSLTNPMAACCGRGWGENPNSASKMDCVESYMPPSPPTFQSFRDFYLAGAAPDDLATAGLTYPNQMFILDKNGIPVNGFYDQNGRRCNYRDAGTKNAKNLTAPQQMAIFTKALTDLQLPIGALFNTDVDPLCCNLVVMALERRCPINNVLGVPPSVTVATTDGGTRRCTAAREMKLDYAIYDLCDPSLVKRERFRVATSYTGEDPTRATVSVNTPINVQSLIAEFYPSVVPMVPPSCPATAAVYQLPWSAGMCRLNGDPFP